MNEAWAKEVTELLKAIKHAVDLNTARLDGVETRLDRIEERVDRMEGRLDRIEGSVKALEDGQARHERLLEQLALGYIENTPQIKELKRSN